VAAMLGYPATNYDLAKEILFPIPVITGIGHVTNETVCEMILTPTQSHQAILNSNLEFS
jgi:exodeoxyribonuclease VII large subunit